MDDVNLRNAALKYALDTISLTEDRTSEKILEAAQKYFAFLKTGV